MALLGTPPLAVRREFNDETEWGPISFKLRRYEIATPRLAGPIIGISNAAGCIHGGRATLTIRIGGGQLKAAPADLLRHLIDEGERRLDSSTTGPAELTRRVVSWLEEEQRSGFLAGSYTTADLLLAVNDVEGWAWLVCPHGVIHGSRNAMTFVSTDLRYPVLRELGLMKEAPFKFLGMEQSDAASSICCIGTPEGYEMLRTPLAPDEMVIALDRGVLPFGPWPKQPISCDALWRMDAAWKHGLSGYAIVLGCLSVSDLAVPRDWTVREVPLGP